jgi:large subunit ribosomal protein L16
MTKVSFGSVGLKATTAHWVTSRQIESARRVLTRYTKKTGKLWIRIFPDKPITQKALGVRQGSGKGNVEYWVALVQPGRVLYEIGGVDHTIAKEALELARAKLSVSTVIVDI